jgi:hypothetical protein
MAMAPKGPAKPDHVFVAPSAARSLVMVLTLAGVTATGLGAWWGYTHDSGTSYGLAVGAAIVTVACWVFLQITVPQRVTITASVVEIKNGGRVERYDLEDPGTDMLVRDGEVAFGHYRDNWSIVRAKDVDWRPFMDVVMRYQLHADINAEERDKRFNR